MQKRGSPLLHGTGTPAPVPEEPLGPHAMEGQILSWRCPVASKPGSCRSSELRQHGGSCAGHPAEIGKPVSYCVQSVNSQTPRSESAVFRSAQDDGSFWISWEEVLRFFSHFYIAWSPAALSLHSFAVHGCWNPWPHFVHSTLTDDTEPGLVKKGGVEMSLFMRFMAA